MTQTDLIATFAGTTECQRCRNSMIYITTDGAFACCTECPGSRLHAAALAIRYWRHALDIGRLEADTVRIRTPYYKGNEYFRALLTSYPTDTAIPILEDLAFEITYLLIGMDAIHNE